jgi:hypothetical protein
MQARNRIELAQKTLPACRRGARLDLAAGATKRVNRAMVGCSMAVSDASSSPNQSSMAATRTPTPAEINQTGELRVHVDGDIGQLQCRPQIGGAPRLDIRLGRVRGMLWHGCSVA